MEAPASRFYQTVDRRAGSLSAADRAPGVFAWSQPADGHGRAAAVVTFQARPRPGIRSSPESPRESSQPPLRRGASRSSPDYRPGPAISAASSNVRHALSVVQRTRIQRCAVRRSQPRRSRRARLTRSLARRRVQLLVDLGKRRAVLSNPGGDRRRAAARSAHRPAPPLSRERIASVSRTSLADSRAAERGRAHVLRLRTRSSGSPRTAASRSRSLFSVKTFSDRLVRDRLRALDADVVVGDHRDVRVAELELAGEVALRVRGHVDHVPARRPGTSCDSARVEKRGPWIDDDRAAVAHRDAELARRLDEEPAQVGAVRVGRRDVRRLRPVVERVRAAASCGRRTGRRRRTRRAPGRP